MDPGDPEALRLRSSPAQRERDDPSVHPGGDRLLPRADGAAHRVLSEGYRIRTADGGACIAGGVVRAARAACMRCPAFVPCVGRALDRRRFHPSCFDWNGWRGALEGIRCPAVPQWRSDGPVGSDGERDRRGGNSARRYRAFAHRKRSDRRAGGWGCIRHLAALRLARGNARWGTGNGARIRCALIARSRPGTEGTGGWNGSRPRRRICAAAHFHWRALARRATEGRFARGSPPARPRSSGGKGTTHGNVRSGEGVRHVPAYFERVHAAG